MIALPFRHHASALHPSALHPSRPPVQELLVTPPSSTARITLVAPDDLPAGAVVLGLVVAVPDAASTPPPAATSTPTSTQTSMPSSIRALAAVRAPQEPARPTAPDAEDGLLHPRPGLVIDRWGRRVRRDGAEVALTRREFDLLEYLARHPDRVFTRSQLLAAVWDFPDPHFAPDRTVDVHVSRLRRKLGAAHAVALDSLRGVGYRWSSAPPTGDVP